MLTIAFNKPFSDAGYGNMMAAAISAAGLPDRCVLHGLRKAAARRLAEAGCTEKEIAAVTGHTTLKEVARYTRAADQKRPAAGAVAKLTEQMLDADFPTLQIRVGKIGKKISHFSDQFPWMVPVEAPYERPAPSDQVQI